MWPRINLWCVKWKTYLKQIRQYVTEAPKCTYSLTQLFHFQEYIPRELLNYKEVSIADKKPKQV